MLQHGVLKRTRSEVEGGEEDEQSAEDVDSDYSDEQTATPASRQRFEICEQCDEEYDVLLNDNKSCNRHSGELYKSYGFVDAG